MENLSEPSSSISFTSSSHLSNGSTSYTNVRTVPTPLITEPRSNLEIISLNRLSTNLEKLLFDSGSENECNYSDAEVVVEGISVGIHRCILATRSKFFSELFKDSKRCVEKDGKPRYIMSDLLPYGNVGYEAFLVFLSYVYTGKVKASPVEVSTCVDDGCLHVACRPAISFAVELTYAASVFQVPELVSLFQRRLLNFVDKAVVEDVIPILVVAFHCQLQQVLSRCIDQVVRSDLDTISLEKELPFEVAQNVRSLRNNFQDNDEHTVEVESEGAILEKRIKSIHKALDCEDVELLNMILNESKITLDEACALHYVVSYCDKKVAKEVLDLNRADVNLRNSRGYTVLHVAAMRKEPSIIVSLLNKGANASDTTHDGQSAVSICRRLTRPKDYHAKIEHGQETNKDRICIDVLEREIRRNPMIDVSVCSSEVADDLHMKLLYLENRVAFARLLFPSEAKLAMEIAHAQTTSEFPGLLGSKGSNGNLREMDLNETPLVQNKRLLSRMEALSRTVEMGRRYFPHCSAVLDNFMEDDLHELFDMENSTLEEQEIKRTRYVELKEEVQRAFTKDKAELDRGLSSSMDTPRGRHGGKNKARKFS